MQFIDLAIQQNRIRDKLLQNIQTVMDHGKYIMGPEIKDLEEKLSSYVGVKHAIACSSGTDALLLALMAFDVGPGDAIFTTPFTFIATAEVISILGATPVFIDIDPRTFNIDPTRLEQAVSALISADPALHPLPSHSTARDQHLKLSAKGIIAVDLFGLPADYNKINAIAQKHGLFVIEDAAQSFGAEYNEKKACSLGQIACTSFFPAKPLGCYGDGGMSFTDDQGKAQILRSLMVHGKGTHKYDNVRIGINGRLDTLQAAILLAKLNIFPEEIRLRQQVAKRYTELLVNCASITAPVIPEGYRCAWAQYSVLAKDGGHRSIFQEKLEKNGIPTAIYYLKPLHLQTAFRFLGYKKGNFPISEDCASRIFSLPMHPYLKAEEQGRIAKILREL